MPGGYEYDHTWEMERVRLAGLEEALDPGTREHLARLGARPGARCLEIGAGRGSVAFWLAERVAPGGVVVATDLETDFLESEAPGYPTLEVVRHDIAAEDLPTGFDLVHARYLVEWLPDKRGALRRMASALRPGGALLIEEPDFVTLYGSGDSPAVRHVFLVAMRHLESICSIDCRYGGHALGDLAAVGLRDVQAEGRCPIVRGGTPLARDFLRLTIVKLREPVLETGEVSAEELERALADLQDPELTIVAPMTVAAWGRRP